jgi:hypothetical protein
MLVDKITERREPAYNAQISLDEESEIIIAKEVSNEPTANSAECTLPFALCTKFNGAYVTDGGYCKDKNITEAETIGVKKLILPINTESKSQATEVVRQRANSEEGKELLKRRSFVIERIISFTPLEISESLIFMLSVAMLLKPKHNLSNGVYQGAVTVTAI